MSTHQPLPYDMIMLDLDGTLLDRTQYIPQGNLDALREAARRGAYIVIATGRIYEQAKHIIDQLGLDHPFLSCNGSCGMHSASGPVLWRIIMEAHHVKKTIACATKYDAAFFLNSEGKMYLNERERDNWDEDWRATVRERGMQLIVGHGDELAQLAQYDTMKAVICTPDHTALAAMQKELEDEGLLVTSSWTDNIEVMPIGADKGSGLARLAKHYGIPLERTIAMGDHGNDSHMLQRAGFSVAMGNAMQEIKQICKATTLHHDKCGVAAAVYHYVLGEDEKAAQFGEIIWA